MSYRVFMYGQFSAVLDRAVLVRAVPDRAVLDRGIPDLAVPDRSVPFRESAILKPIRFDLSP